MFTPEDMRAQFETMGRHLVARKLDTNGFNQEWQFEAAHWLAEQDAAAELEQTKQSAANFRFSRSAAIAGWVAVALTLVGIGIQLLGTAGSD